MNIYESLDRALEDRKIPLANRTDIRRFAASVGVVGVAGTSGYIKAVRSDGGRDLWIHSGYTTGFVSEGEARTVAGALAVWPSEKRPGLWGVTHPVHGNERTEAQSAARTYAACPSCAMVRSASGTCGCD